MVDPASLRAWTSVCGGLARCGGAAAANRRIALRRLRESQTPQTAFKGSALERFSIAPILTTSMNAPGVLSLLGSRPGVTCLDSRSLLNGASRFGLHLEHHGDGGSTIPAP